MYEASLAMLNTPEIIALLVLALIFFGAKKLPEMAKGLGHGIKEFRKATREVTDELHSAVEGDPTPRPALKPPAESGPEAVDSGEYASEEIASVSGEQEQDQSKEDPGKEKKPDSQPA